jgi:hypothetical protein
MYRMPFGDLLPGSFFYRNPQINGSSFGVNCIDRNEFQILIRWPDIKIPVWSCPLQWPTCGRRWNCYWFLCLKVYGCLRKITRRNWRVSTSTSGETSFICEFQNPAKIDAFHFLGYSWLGSSPSGWCWEYSLVNKSLIANQSSGMKSAGKLTVSFLSFGTNLSPC